MASVPSQQQAPSRSASSFRNTPPAISSSAEALESSISSGFTFAEAPSGATSPPAQTVPTPTINEAEPRRCWICFSDETDDTPESGAWRSPCPCNLEAHEACLLQWVADIEAPKPGQSTAAHADIRCPQCKSKIYLARPRSYVVDAVGAVEKHFSGALLPAVVLGIGYTVVLGASHHGAHTIRTIFGYDEAEAILAPLRPSQWSSLERYAMQNFPVFAAPLFRTWRGIHVELGLPLIPAVLVMSRTSLLDAPLPILPIAFFATHPDLSNTLRLGYWPPSAALTFTVLPYIRSAYNSVMKRTLLPYERRWLEEVKPGLGAEAEEAAANEDAAAAAAEMLNDDVDVINIEIGMDMDMDMFGDDTDDEDDEDMPGLEDIPAREVQDLMNPPPQAPPLHAPPQDDVQAPADDAAPAPELPFQQPQQPDAQPAPARPHRQRREIDIIQYSRKVADSIVGALLFPTIAAGCGELLRLLLPLSWTVATRRMQGPQPDIYAAELLGRLATWAGFSGNRTGSSSSESKLVPTGLLQTRWGRSVVGGCLFVVIKDMVRFYCRWRMAVSFRERKVRNWDKKAGRLVD